MTAISSTVLSPSQAEQLRARINDGITQGNSVVNSIINRVNEFLRWLPGFITDRVNPILNRLRDIANTILQKLGELLVGLDFPVVAFLLANDWVDKVKNPVDQVSGAVSNNNLEVDDYWQGAAADAYSGAVTSQTDAMGEAAAIADEVKDHLWALAGIVGGFYVALAVVLYQWIGVLIASAAATATGVGAVAGVPAAAADTGVSAAAIGGLVAAAIALIAGEAKTFTDLNDRVSTSAKFPHGHWPTVVKDAMSDASETDGDGTDWHVKAAG